MALSYTILTRTTPLTCTTATKTVVPFDTEVTNGPDSWWDSGTPNSIVMPWPGQYWVNLFGSWPSVSTGLRCIWLCSGTDATIDANRVVGTAHTSLSATEAGSLDSTSGIITVASAGSSYVVGVLQANGVNQNLQARFAHQACQASFVYLGSYNRLVNVNQTINRSNLW